MIYDIASTVVCLYFLKLTFSKNDSPLQVPSSTSLDEQDLISNHASPCTIAEVSEHNDEHLSAGRLSIDCIGASGSEDNVSGTLSAADGIGFCTYSYA